VLGPVVTGPVIFGWGGPTAVGQAGFKLRPRLRPVRPPHADTLIEQLFDANQREGGRTESLGPWPIRHQIFTLSQMLYHPDVDRPLRRPRHWVAAAIAILLAVAGLAASPTSTATATTTTLSVGVPAGFFPSERDYPGSARPMWNRLAAAGPRVGIVAIIDPGPPSIDYVDFVAREQQMGQRVVVELPSHNYKARLSSLREWLPVNGVLLTDAAPDCSNVSGSAVAETRSQGLLVAVDAGLSIGSCWQNLADVIVLRSTWNGASVPAPPSWWDSADGAQLWVQQFSVPSFAITAAVTSAGSQSATYLFATPDSAIDESRLVPEAGYWDTLVHAISGSLPRQADPVSDSQRQQIALPLYGPNHPSWSQIAATSSATVPYIAVNVANGPGPSPLPTLRAQIDAARNRGTKVLGYLHTSYGNRANSLSVAEAQQWVSFYGVDGFFIDELLSECSGEPNVRQLVSALRIIRPNATVVLNPGRNISECFAQRSGADAILVFEGTAASFMSWTPSAWTFKYPSTMFWHMVFAASPSDLPAISHRSRGQHAGMLFINTLASPTQWETAIDPVTFAQLIALNAAPPPRRAATAVPAPVVAPRIPAGSSPGNAPSGPRESAPQAPPAPGPVPALPEPTSLWPPELPLPQVLMST
jgi:hypothetical protein